MTRIPLVAALAGAALLAGCATPRAAAPSAAPDVPFAGKADSPRYFNKRSEIHFKLAEWVKAGGCLPNDPALAQELTAHTFSLRGDKLWVLEKELVRQALGPRRIGPTPAP